MPTKIEWTEESWNPVTGCSPKSDGCAHCYAERMAKRLAGRYGYPKEDPFRVTFHSDRLDQPLKWKKPRKIFICSMGDLFHNNVLPAWQKYIFQRIEDCSRHIFIILTKRPHNMADFIAQGSKDYWRPWPLPNVWLGVTVESAKYLDRVETLLQIPANIRFISCEPLLEHLDIGDYLGKEKINWVIVGAETGPGARPMNLDWARNIRDQCKAAGVPFFMKKPFKWDLQIREWPQ